MPIIKTWCQPFKGAYEVRLGVAWRTYLWAIKHGLATASVGAWEVIASSDRNSAGFGDLWTDWSKVNGRLHLNDLYHSPGSWALLKSPPSPKGPYWLILDSTTNSVDANSATVRFMVTRHEPDLSKPSSWTYRLPEFTGPHLLVTSPINDGFSGYPAEASQIHMVVADDGSFCFLPTYPVGYNVGDTCWPRGYVIFNILDETVKQDTFGAVFMAIQGTHASSIYKDSRFNSAGAYIDPDGVQVNLNLTKESGRLFWGGSFLTYCNRVEALIEDPYWGKYGSSPIYLYCNNSGRQGIRGRMVDLWWMHTSALTGVMAYAGSSYDQRVGTMKPFWVPCPEVPWRF